MPRQSDASHPRSKHPGSGGRLDPSALPYAFTFVAWLVTFLREWPTDWLNGDFISWFFWLPALRHPGLYAGDLVASAWRPLAPPVLVAVYGLLGRWLAWSSVSKLISAGVVTAFLTGSWSLGRALLPKAWERCLFAAWVAGAAGAIVVMQGGIPRGFGPPLQIWCLALMLRNRSWAALAVVAASACLHAVSFVLLAPLYVLWYLRPERTEAAGEGVPAPGPGRPKPRIVVVVLLLCTGGLALQSRNAERTLGPMLSRREVLVTRPEWQPGGRMRYERPIGFAREFWSLAARRLHEKHAADVAFQGLVAAYLLAAAVLLVMGRLRLPRVLGWYLLVSLAAYALAYLLIPRLYAPNRYLQVSVLVLVGASIAVAFGRLDSALAGRARWCWRWMGAAFGILALPGGIHYNGLDAFGPGAPVTGVSGWLREHLPVHGMYAAFPRDDADALLLPTERPCLMAYKCDQGMYRDYLAESSRRLRLLFPAYYAFDTAEVEALARRTPTRYLVIRRSDLGSSAAGRLYPEPHGTAIRRWVEGHAGRPWLWTGRNAPAPAYQDAQYLVFDLEPFRRPSSRPSSHPVISGAERRASSRFR